MGVYEVSYKVLPPDSMDADVVAERANRIAQMDSDESEAFRQVLGSTDGVSQVGQIIPKVPAYIVQETTTTTTGAYVQQGPGKSSTSALPFAIGGVAGFAVLLLLGVTIYKRKGGAGCWKAKNRWLECEEADNPAIPRVPSNTLLDSLATQIEQK